MLTDPISVTIGATPVSLPRVGIDRNSAEYQASDSNTRLRVLQSQSATVRRTSIVLTSNKIAADPVSAVNSRKSQAVTIGFVGPLDGFTIVELKDLFKASSDALLASSAAMLLKILGGEK